MVKNENSSLRIAALENAVRVASSFAEQGEYDTLMDSTLLTSFGEGVVLPLADLFYAWLKKSV